MEKSYNSVTKHRIRSEIRRLRHKYPEKNREFDEKKLLKKESFINILPKAGGKLFIYYSIKDEFPTKKIIKGALEQGIQVYLPKISGKEMIPSPIRSLDDVVKGPAPFYIPEPRNTGKSPGKMDLVLLPGLAFDRKGGRLGYGGGYYDRYLSENPPKLAVAIGYDFQIIDAVPMKEGDIYLDGIVTPSYTLLKNGSGVKK